MEPGFNDPSIHPLTRLQKSQDSIHNGDCDYENSIHNGDQKDKTPWWNQPSRWKMPKCQIKPFLSSTERPTDPTPMGISVFANEPGWTSVSVPGDGDCWFWAVAFAVNFPGTPFCSHVGVFPHFPPDFQLSAIPLTVSKLREKMAHRLSKNQHLLRRILETTIDPMPGDPLIQLDWFKIKTAVWPFFEAVSENSSAENAAKLQQILQDIRPAIFELAMSNKMWSDWYTIKAMNCQPYTQEKNDPLHAHLQDPCSNCPYFCDPLNHKIQFFIRFVVVEIDSETRRFVISFHDRYLCQHKMKTIVKDSSCFHFVSIFTLLHNQHYTLLQFKRDSEQSARRVFNQEETKVVLSSIPFRSEKDAKYYQEFCQEFRVKHAV